MSIPEVITDIDELHTHGLVTGAEAAKIVDTTYRRIDMWAVHGLVPPTLEASGRGTRRGYDLDDLVKLVLARDLYDAGLTNLTRESFSAMLDKALAARGPATWPFRSLMLTLDSGFARHEVWESWFETIDGSDA